MSDQNFWEQYTQAFGANATTLLRQALADPRLGGRILIDEGQKPAADVDQTMLTIGSFIKGGPVSHEQFAKAFHDEMIAIRNRFTFQAIAADDLPAGHRTDLLLEAGYQLLSAKTNAGFKLTLVEIDQPAFKADLEAATANRALLKNLGTLTDDAYNNNRVVEDRIFRVLSREYGKVRKAALADRDLLGELDLVEKYLFEPAQVGAQTAKDNRDKAKTMLDKAEEKAYVNADQAVRQNLAGEMQGLVDNLVQRVPGAPPSSAPGHTGTSHTNPTPAGPGLPGPAGGTSPHNRRGPAR